jgi:hypothetical protein
MQNIGMRACSGDEQARNTNPTIAVKGSANSAPPKSRPEIASSLVDLLGHCL